jgi:hypothetical protein
LVNAATGSEKKHRAEAADEHVVMPRLESMDLRVAEFVGDVLQTGIQRQKTRSFEHFF